MGKKILLADDSLTIQKVVELTLAGTDYELTCVSNGQKALESLDRSRPDLILADVVMPEKNGYEVCEAVKGNPATAEIPVLLLSGTFEPFDRDRADRVGADRVVSKPFDAQDLLDQIETLLIGLAGAPAPDSPAPREGPFENAFLDDTIPTARAGGRTETESLSYEESTPPEGADRGLEADWSSGATAQARSAPSLAEAESSGVEEYSGGPVFLPDPATRAASEEAPTRHPVEEAPGPGSEAGIEEISAEEAAAFFDVAAAAPPAPVSSAAAASELTSEQIERIAALVVAKLSDRVLREIAWEVVPDVAEMVVKRRIEELEGGVE